MRPSEAKQDQRRTEKLNPPADEFANKAAQRFQLQPLEERLLFSANTSTATEKPLTSEAAAAISAGLQEVVKFAGALDEFGALDTEVGGVGKSLGDLFDLGSTNGKDGFLGVEFAQPLDQFLSKGGATADSVSNFLKGLTVVKGSDFDSIKVNQVSGGYYAGTDEFEWEVTIQGQRTSTVALDPGADLAVEGLSLTVAPDLNIVADAAMKFSFGVKSDGSGFFITLSDLDLGAKTDTGKSLAFDVNVKGGNPLSVQGGQVQLNAQVSDINVTVPKENGRITAKGLASLTDGLTPEEVSYAGASGSLKADLPLTVQPTGVAAILINSANPLDGIAPDVTVNYSLANTSLQSGLLSLLSAMDSSVSGITDAELLHQNLPIIDKSIADLSPEASFGSFLSFKTVAADYFKTAAAPDLVGLLTALQSHFDSIDSVTSAKFHGAFNAATNQVEFSVALESNREIEVDASLDGLGDAVTEMAFEGPTDLKVKVKGTANAAFTIGIDVADTIFEATDFYLKVDELSASAKIASKDLGFGVKIGPMSANVVGGSIDLTAKATAKFADPNGDGRLNASEVSGQGVQVTSSGKIDIKLPLEMSFGGYDFKENGQAPSLHFASSQTFTQSVEVDTTTPNFQRIFNLGKMGAEQVLSLLTSAGDWAAQFRNSSVFDVQIPFLDGVDLGDAFDFGTLFSANLRDKLTLTEVSIVSGASSLSLAKEAPFILAIDGSETNSKLVTIPAGNYASAAEMAVAFNAALKAAYGSSSPVTAVVDLGSDRKANTEDDRVKLVAGAGVKESFSVVGSLATLSKLGFYTGETTAALTGEKAVPTDGKLTGDARFAISINGSEPVVMKLTKTATDDNVTPSDLAADVQNALKGVGIHNITVTESDGKLVFKGDNSVDTFILIGDGDSAWGQLGFAESNTVGMGAAGSIEKTTPAFSTFQELVPMLANALHISENAIAPVYDPETETIRLHVKLDYDAAPIQLPVGFGMDLGDLTGLTSVDAKGNAAPAYITLKPKLGAELTFGYSFNPTTAPEVLSVAPTEGYISPAGYDSSSDSYSPAVWNGRLSADAHLTVILDNGRAVELTIPKVSTDANTSVSDLVADINAVIAATPQLAGKVEASLLPATANTAERVQIATVAGASRSLQVKASLTDPAVRELGFEKDTFAQGSDQAITVSAVSNVQNVKLESDATFNVSIDGGATQSVVITAESTKDNDSFADLLVDINAAIKTAGLDGKLVATRFGAIDRVLISTIGDVRTLRFDVETEDPAAKVLGFSDSETFMRAKGGGYFVEDLALSADGTIDVNDLHLSGQLGYLGITSGDSSGLINLGVRVAVRDTVGKTHFALNELYTAVLRGGIDKISDVTATGSANFELTGIGVESGLFPVADTAKISFAVSDLFAGSLTVTPAFSEMTAVTNFAKLDFATVFNAVKQGVQAMSNYAQFAFLRNSLPVINLSPVEILDYSKQFSEAIATLEDDPAGVLQALESKIEDILKLPKDFVNLSIEGANHDVVKLSFTLEKAYTDTFGLNLDLEDLNGMLRGGLPKGLEGIAAILDGSPQGSIQVAAFAEAVMDIGIDLSGSGAPKTFLFDTSALTFGVRLAGQNLNINANIGFVGLGISGGTVLLDSDGYFDVYDQKGRYVPNGDGIIDDDYATFRISLKNNAEPGTPNDGRHYFTESFTAADDFTVAYQGQFFMDLPSVLKLPNGDVDLDQSLQMMTNAADFADLIQRTDGTHPLQILAPDIKSLMPETPSLIQMIRDSSILLDGLDSALFKVQRALDSKTSQNIPLIGRHLAEAGQFIEDFREGVLSSVTEVLRGADDDLLQTLRGVMFDLFHNKLDILQDYNGDEKVDINDLVLSYRRQDGTVWREGVDDPNTQDAVQFNMHLGDSYKADTSGWGIDFGIPGFKLALDGSPSAEFNWDFYFGFGISVSDLFYLDTQPTNDGQPKNANNKYVEHELQFGFELQLTSDPKDPFNATGQLFGLQLHAEDQRLQANNAKPTTEKGHEGNFSYVKGAVEIDIIDPGVGKNWDDRLTFPEMFKRAPKPIFDVNLTADVDINLKADFSIMGLKVIPRILADVNIDWMWKAGDDATAPIVGLNNVKLDLGSFLTDFLGPLAEQIDKALKPFDPIIDALNTRIPVLSEFMGRDFTVLDLARTFGFADARFIQSIIDIRKMVGDIAAAQGEETAMLDLGGILDIGQGGAIKNAIQRFDPTKYGVSNAPASIDEAKSMITRKIMENANRMAGGGLQFPILRPANIFKLLLGQEANLFTYDFPRLEVKMSMGMQFAIFPPLFATISGSITAWADVAVGFDSKGITQFQMSGDVLDILDGFYISDREFADGTGRDVPEAGLIGKIGIGGSLNLGFIRAGVEGYFKLTADLDLNDPNDDGKIRGSEILALLNYETPDGKHYGPLNLGTITLRGEVGARAYVDIFAIFSWATIWEYEFFRTTIFEKVFQAPHPEPQLAQLSPTGNLQINSGSGARGRLFGSTRDVGENYTMRSLSDGRVEVTFNNTNTTQIFSGVTRIEMHLGKGNDVVDASALNIPVFLYGEDGDDTLIAGSAGGILDGGNGNDVLIGGRGNDTLIGGAGDDDLTAGEGSDILEGGEGRDHIFGGLGNDTYRFGNNWGVDVLELLEDGDAANADMMDFGAATDSLTVSIGSVMSKVTSGRNSVVIPDSVGEVRMIRAGQGRDTINVAASSPAGISIDGYSGSDTYTVSFGRVQGTVNIFDTNARSSDSDTLIALPIGSDPIVAYDAALISTRKGGTQELVNFDGGIDNLTIEAPKSVVTIGEALSFAGDVRVKALTAVIPNAINAGYIRVDSKNSVEINGDLNTHASGNIEVVVSKGDLAINANVTSSVRRWESVIGSSSLMRPHAISGQTGLGGAGDGTGIIQLISRTGEITADGTGVVRSAYGSLLLQGATGSIGTKALPILTQVGTLAAYTDGTDGIVINEEDGVVIQDVSITSGLTANGGEITLTNFTKELRFERDANAKGGEMTFTTDEIQINGNLVSPGADLHLQPVHTNTTIGLGNGTTATFNMETSEISHLVDGFNSITVGRDDGAHDVYIEDVKFVDPVVVQTPILGGRIYQTGVISSDSSVTVIGDGHTILLDNQLVSSGNINILDSAIVREGESIRLDAAVGNVNINFDVDGTLGGAGETLTLNAPHGIVVIKGNIGTIAKLENLVIENASAVYLEGSVNVANLTIKNSDLVRIYGAVTADKITFENTGYADFRSSVSANTIQNGTTGVLGTAVFQGSVSANSVNLTATTLVDFYQSVNTTGSLDVTTTGLMGDIVFRQQVTANGAITVNSQDDITFTGPVTAANVTVESANDLAFQGKATVAGALRQLIGTGMTNLALVQAGSIDLHAANMTMSNPVTATNGDIVLETGSNGTIIASGNVAASAGALRITKTGAATFAARVDVKSADVTAEGEVRFGGIFTAAGNAVVNSASALSFLSTATIGGNLTVSSTGNTTFSGQLQVTGNVTQVNGRGTTRFEGVTQAANISVQTLQQVYAGNIFRAVTGDIVLESDEIDFVGGTNTVQGNGKLVLRGAYANTTIDVGSPSPGGTLDISDLDVNALRDGFTDIIIGREEDGAAAMVISSSVFKDNVEFHAGSITVAANPVAGQQVSSLESIEMTARVGDISINDDVVAADIRLTARDNVIVNHHAEGAQFVTIKAGTDGSGDVTITAAGEVVAGAKGADITIDAGTVAGNIGIAGKIAANDDLTMTASVGAITQTAGNSAATDLYATAQSGITLLTTIDHVSASVTGAGDLTITDVNADPLHVVNLGSESDAKDGLFTADGKITVNVNTNANALRVLASKGLFLGVTGNVLVRNITGSPSYISGTAFLDEDRTTSGDDMTFAGDVRLLRDVTLASNGGNIKIGGVVSSTGNQQFSLTLDADGGDVTVGGGIGGGAAGVLPLSFLKVLDAHSATFGTAGVNSGAIRVAGNIEINANAIQINAAADSVRTLNGGELILRPLSSVTAIDIGSPAGGTAEFSISDSEIRALADGFSKITIGQVNGAHAVKIESAQFRDSLVISGATIDLLSSAMPQGVTGLSVVNGDDDNSITLNATERFTQGKRAAVNAGRYGDIVITADRIELDELNRNLVRGFGNLVLQPSSATQAITLGTAGSDTDFDLTAGELGTLADGFQSVTIGRANGEHAIVIDGKLLFRDNVTIQAPVGNGSITVGTGITPASISMVGKGDTLTLTAGGYVTVDASLSTVGSGALQVTADADGSGEGDLVIGQNLAGKNAKLALITQNGEIRLSGENVRIGKIDKKVGMVQLVSKLGNVQVTANRNADSTGEIVFANAKSTITTGGKVTLGSTLAAAQAVTLGGIKITAQKGFDLQALGNVTFNAGTKLIAKSGPVQILSDRTSGALTFEKGSAIQTAQPVLLSAFTVNRQAGAVIPARNVTVEQG